MDEKDVYSDPNDLVKVGESAQHEQVSNETSCDKDRAALLSDLRKENDALARRLMKRRKKKATGPVTESGKSVSSRNSYKTGAYATKILPESDTYWQLEKAMRSDLHPDGPVESLLVASGIRNLSSLISIQELKHNRIVVSENTKIDTQELAKRVGFPWADSHHQVLEEPANEHLLLRRMHLSWEILAKPPKATKSNEVMTPADSRVAVLYKRAKQLLALPTLNAYAEFDFFSAMDVVMQEAREGKNYLGKRVHGDSEHLGLLIDYWLYRNARELSMCHHDIRNERTLRLHTDPALSRAEATANKNFRDAMSNLSNYRALRPVMGSQPASQLIPTKGKK